MLRNVLPHPGSLHVVVRPMLGSHWLHCLLCVGSSSSSLCCWSVLLLCCCLFRCMCTRCSSQSSMCCRRLRMVCFHFLRSEAFGPTVSGSWPALRSTFCQYLRVVCLSPPVAVASCWFMEGVLHGSHPRATFFTRLESGSRSMCPMRSSVLTSIFCLMLRMCNCFRTPNMFTPCSCI